MDVSVDQWRRRASASRLISPVKAPPRLDIITMFGPPSNATPPISHLGQHPARADTSSLLGLELTCPLPPQNYPASHSPG